MQDSSFSADVYLGAHDSGGEKEARREAAEEFLAVVEWRENRERLDAEIQRLAGQTNFDLPRYLKDGGREQVSQMELREEG